MKRIFPFVILFYPGISFAACGPTDMVCQVVSVMDYSDLKEAIFIIVGLLVSVFIIAAGFAYIETLLGMNPQQKRRRQWERQYVERERFREEYRQRRRRAFNTTVSIASWRHDGTGRYRAPFWDKTTPVDEWAYTERVWPDNDSKHRIPDRPAKYLDLEYGGRRRHTRIETDW